MNRFYYLFAICLSSILFIQCGDDDIPEEMMEAKTLEGDYSGIWSSTTESASFPSTAVTARLEFLNDSQSKLIGELFISSNFTSCCNSGNNDGTLQMDLDGGTISNFKYSDVIPGCGGNFEGDGSYDDELSISISFTGQDCDGNHIGTLRLNRL